MTGRAGLGFIIAEPGRAGILMYPNGPGRAEICRAGLAIFGPYRALCATSDLMLIHPKKFAQPSVPHDYPCRGVALKVSLTHD